MAKLVTVSISYLILHGLDDSSGHCLPHVIHSKVTKGQGLWEAFQLSPQTSKLWVVFRLLAWVAVSHLLQLSQLAGDMGHVAVLVTSWFRCDRSGWEWLPERQSYPALKAGCFLLPVVCPTWCPWLKCFFHVDAHAIIGQGLWCMHPLRLDFCGWCCGGKGHYQSILDKGWIHSAHGLGVDAPSLVDDL